MHKSSNSREYAVWQRIKTYCYNEKAPCFKKYGARGITVCKEWVNDFDIFLEDMGHIPEGYNGIHLAEGHEEFCKWTCKWVKKKAGRPALNKPKKESSGKNKKLGFKTPKSICLVLEKEHLDFIKAQALKRSLSEGVPVEANQLIREALQKAFPTPRQVDMFGKKK